MKIDNDTPHVHEPRLGSWNWVTDRPYAFCVCGYRMDDVDPLTFATMPEIDDVYTSPDPYIKVDENGQPCGVSWLVDVRLGAVVFGLGFAVALVVLWVFGR